MLLAASFVGELVQVVELAAKHLVASIGPLLLTLRQVPLQPLLRHLVVWVEGTKNYRIVKFPHVRDFAISNFNTLKVS